MKKIGKVFALGLLLSFIMEIIGLIPGIYEGFTGVPLDEIVPDRLIFVIRLLGEITLPLFMLWYYRKDKQELDVVMPFKKKIFLKTYCLSYLAGLLFFTAIWGAAVLLGGFSITTMLSGKNIPWLLLFFAGYGVQGMGEEILCRGYVQGRLEQSFSPQLAAIASAAFFAFLHITNPGITFTALIELFLFGVIMAVLRYYTNNLWITGAIHSAWNFAEGPIFGVLVSGLPSEGMVLKSSAIANHTWLNGGAFGIEGSWLSVLIHVLFLVGVLWWFKKKAEVDTLSTV